MSILTTRVFKTKQFSFRPKKSKANPEQSPPELGGGKAPRSYGRVLLAIRENLGKSQAQMFDTVIQADDTFEFPQKTKTLIDKRFGKKHSRYETKKTTNSGVINIMSAWENSQSNIPFCAQFRYARLTNSLNGIAHLVAAFYADFRDTCDKDNDAETQTKFLNQIDANLESLKKFTAKFEEFVVDIHAENSELRELLANEKTLPLNDRDTKYHLMFILDLLDSFRVEDTED